MPRNAKRLGKQVIAKGPPVAWIVYDDRGETRVFASECDARDHFLYLREDKGQLEAYLAPLIEGDRERVALPAPKTVLLPGERVSFKREPK